MTDKPQTDCHDANDLKELREKIQVPENFSICKQLVTLGEEAMKRKIQQEAKERFTR